MTTVFTKAIPSILLIAGAIDKATFSAIEVFKAIKQYQHGDVVPVLDTLSILTNGKFTPTRNKQGAINLRANVTPYTQGAKSNFKRLAACLALLDLIDQEASEENGVMFSELVKQYTVELKTSYEATKTPKVIKDTTAANDTTETATVDATVDTTEAESMTLPVDVAFAATIRAIQAGLLDAAQLVELRMTLAELPSITAQDIAAIH